MKFTDGPIQALCAKLELGEVPPNFKEGFGPSRGQFMWAAGGIALRLEFYRQTAERPVSTRGSPRGVNKNTERNA